MVVRRGGKGGGDTEPRERQPGNRLPSRRHTTVDTDGYDISEVRGHLRFILSFVLHAAQLCLPSAPSTSPFTLPFISIRFFCRSCSLIISFCSSLAHVTFSLSLSLFLLAPSPCPCLETRASILFFPLHPRKPGLSGPSAEGRLLFLPPGTLVLLFPVGLLAASFSSAHNRGSSFTRCSRVILQIERSVQIDFVHRPWSYVFDFNFITPRERIHRRFEILPL